MTRVAMIGAGNWGKNIIQTLRKNPTSTIAYIAYTGSAETTAWLTTHCPDIPTYTDYHEVLTDTTVDAVCIATPITTHETIVRDALSAGKHVFVEKPLSTTAEEIVALYALAEEKNLVLFPGYLYLFDPEFQVLKKQTSESNQLTIEMHWEKYGTFDTPLAENLLVHELALAHELIGTLTLAAVIRSEKDICDITVRGERGTAHIFIDRTCKERKKKLTLHNGAEKEVVSFTHPNLLDLECEAFFAAIAHGSAGNKKRQRIDESIAAVLSSLPRP